MLMDGGDGRRALVSLRENLLFCFWVFFFSHPGSVSLMATVYTVSVGSDNNAVCLR